MCLILWVVDIGQLLICSSLYVYYLLSWVLPDTDVGISQIAQTKVLLKTCHRLGTHVRANKYSHAVHGRSAVKHPTGLEHGENMLRMLHQNTHEDGMCHSLNK